MKTICITGATSGIGEACAIELAKKGHELILCGRRQERLLQLKHELESEYKIQVHALVFDIRDYKACETIVTQHQTLFEKLDVLINNAGLAAGLAPIHEGQLDHWERMIDTNVKGLLYMSRLISPLMVKQKHGKIILVGSIAGKEVYANGNVYCATKHAVDALARSMRLDLIAHGVQVSAVHPGMVETEFSLVRFEGDAKRAKQVYQNMQPLRGKDVALTITWMIECPEPIHLADVVVFPNCQASATQVQRWN